MPGQQQFTLSLGFGKDDAGTPVETPQVVACRYESEACNR